MLITCPENILYLDEFIVPAEHLSISLPSRKLILTIDTIVDPRQVLIDIHGNDKIILSESRNNIPTTIEYVVSPADTTEELVNGQSFTRQSTTRLAVSRKNGLIFRIIADNCVSKGDRNDLNQITVEYIAKLPLSSENNQVVDQSEIDADCSTISSWLYKEYRYKQQIPHKSSTSKYEWATSKKNSERKASNAFGKGSQAIIEINEINQTIYKQYDLTGAISREELMTDYLAFREAISKFYDIPELLDINLEEDRLALSEKLIPGKKADLVLAEGNEAEIEQLIAGALLPLSGQIQEDTSFVLGPGEISNRPLQNPVDIKPLNFIVEEGGKVVFVDFFPPLTRKRDGSSIQVYEHRDGNHVAWVYGEASVIITKFLMDCIKANPSKLNLITNAVIKSVEYIDPSGLLMLEMQLNAVREKTMSGFNKIKNGQEALEIIKAYSSESRV